MILRISKKHELTFSKKRPIHSSDFYKALLIAFSIHLLLFISLKIATPPNLDQIPIIKSVFVETDLTTSEIASRGKSLKPTPIEKIDPPKLLDIPKPKFLCDTFFPDWEQREIDPDFSEIERIEYELFKFDLDKEEE